MDFRTAYLAGYLADKYDLDARQSVERANARIKKSTEDAFADTVEGYTTVIPESGSVRLHSGYNGSTSVKDSNVQIHNASYWYAMYPVWLLNTTWNGSQYTFAMNGQTGKFVGDLPVDKSAARKWIIGLAALCSAAAYGVVWLLWLAEIL